MRDKVNDCVCVVDELVLSQLFCLFFFTDPATTEIYTLSLHDALPISGVADLPPALRDAITSLHPAAAVLRADEILEERDRKSTRLNSSHGYISYAVFCLKKKKKRTKENLTRRPTHTTPSRRTWSAPER